MFYLRDRWGRTAVHTAARRNYSLVLDSLIAAGGCPLLSDVAGLSAIELAYKHSSKESIELINSLLNTDVKYKNEPAKTDTKFCK